MLFAEAPPRVDNSENVWVTILTRSRQLKINFQGSRVGGNIDQNEPLRLGPSSFGHKLMDHGDLKVYVLKIVLWDQKFSIMPI